MTAQIIHLHRSSAKSKPVPHSSYEPSRSDVADALGRWMRGDPLTPHDDIAIDFALDVNFATQLGRLYLRD